jgi:hypothetical protein
MSRAHRTPTDLQRTKDALRVLNYLKGVRILRSRLKDWTDSNHSEVTLLGNGVNTSEASMTLRWVLKVLESGEDK